MAFEWAAYDEVWYLRRPPLGTEEPDTLTVEILVGLIAEHIQPAEQERFRALLAADEDLDFDVLQRMLDSVHEAVCPDIPRTSMLALVAEFEKHRPLIHGQLLLQGSPKGADGLSVYDAACIALAFMDADFRGTEFTVNEKGRPHLFQQLQIGKAAKADDLDALRQLQQSAGMGAGQTFARPQRRPDPEPAATD